MEINVIIKYAKEQDNNNAIIKNVVSLKLQLNY